VRSVHSSPVNTVSTAIEPPLSEAAAEAWIPRTCFKNGPPSRMGVELELLVVDAAERAPFPADRYSALLAALEDNEFDGHLLDGTITVEPGGQVELSSRPGRNLQDAVDTVARDVAALRGRAARSGARLVGIGMDPTGRPNRITDTPRYTAMERYLDAWGPAGRSMMCSTASVQVNVEAGVAPTVAHPDPGLSPPTPADRRQPLTGFAERWSLLHAIGPGLVAAFANSPYRAGRPTGWKSTRQAVWQQLDPARTGVPPVGPDEDVVASWTRWALDAPLRMLRSDDHRWAAPAGLTFRTWLRLGASAGPGRPPTVDDLAYHLTTLFPQVRPKGYFEVRYLDAQPGRWWTVPCAVISALLGDAGAADQALQACAPTSGRWRDAARVGMDDPEIARAARETLLIAAASLERADLFASAQDVHGYLERWTDRGRCPADDVGHEARSSDHLTDDHLTDDHLTDDPWGVEQ
jgi:glutamate--cysteine ligase